MSTARNRANELYHAGGVTAVGAGGVRLMLHSAGVQNEYWRLRSRLAADPAPVRVNGTDAQFRNETGREYRTVRTFEGELPVVQTFVDDVTDSDVVWDCGANIGLFAVLGGQQGATVHAFDPIPSNARRTQENLDLNGIDGTAHAIALGSEAGTATIPTDSGSGANHSLAEEGDDIVVETGDSVAASADAPTVLKIDVEGMELDVLEGLEDSIDDVRLAYVEVHHRQLAERGESPDEVIAWFEERGFTVERVMQRDAQNEHIRATRH
ncbi:FkbM family methyltransferase [Haloarchaeobius baliensis]|uniref:FkbM family methyltransferase n=1 Tax=Haloarchaeobius baliensis TaxID=1670458 RepID=UPI003F880E11